MQVKNIECQIAQAQLRRYLTGEEMPNAIVGDLETHLKLCPECMDAAQTLRESLRGALSSKITGKPEPQQPKPERKAIAQAVATGMAAVQTQVQTPADLLSAPDSDFKPAKPKRKSSNTKTLFYSGALALVLILMSTIFKDPTALFGPRAYDSHKDTPPATTTTDGAAQTDAQPDQTPGNDATANGAAPIVGALGTDGQATDPQAATQTGQNSASGPLQTNGLIVADSLTGTTLVNADQKQDPKPDPAKGTAKPQTRKKPVKKTRSSAIVHVKVYPPGK